MSSLLLIALDGMTGGYVPASVMLVTDLLLHGHKVGVQCTRIVDSPLWSLETSVILELRDEAASPYLQIAMDPCTPGQHPAADIRCSSGTHGRWAH